MSTEIVHYVCFQIHAALQSNSWKEILFQQIQIWINNAIVNLIICEAFHINGL